jgi:hypothetical protein
MRETANSLRAYFIVVAILGSLSTVPYLFAQNLPLISLIFVWTAFLMNLMFLVIGIFINTFLSKWLVFVRAIIIGNFTIVLCSWALSLYVHVDPTSIVVMVVATLIAWYLWVNVNRLAKELAQA